MSTQSTDFYFEDFQVGQQMESPARTVTETDLVQFAALSGDYNAIHTDAEFAKGTPFGERIVHGLLGLWIASVRGVRAGFVESSVIAFTGLTWKFKKPVLIGDTIRVRAKVAKTRSLGSTGGGMVVFAVQVLNQRDERVQQGEWTMLFKGRAGE